MQGGPRGCSVSVKRLKLCYRELKNLYELKGQNRTRDETDKFTPSATEHGVMTEAEIAKKKLRNSS
jgi:hypothetical protein